MRQLRIRFTRGFVAPVAIALLATYPIELVLQPLSIYMARWFALGWNHWVSSRLKPLFQLPFQQTIGWRFEVFELGAAIAATFAIWLLALWLYPETDAPPAKR